MNGADLFLKPLLTLGEGFDLDVAINGSTQLDDLHNGRWFCFTSDISKVYYKYATEEGKSCYIDFAINGHTGACTVYKIESSKRLIFQLRLITNPYMEFQPEAP